MDLKCNNLTCITSVENRKEENDGKEQEQEYNIITSKS